MSETDATPPPSVRLFRQILIWPLLLKDKARPRRGVEGLGRWKEALRRSRDWREVSQDQRAANRPRDYEEIVYFHSFVRDFLYGDAGSGGVDGPASPMTIFARHDIEQVKVTLTTGSEVHLKVDRAELYLFETFVALLVLEASWDSLADPPLMPELALNDLQDFNDQFRRAYPPAWSEGLPVRFPRELAWKKDGSWKEFEGGIEDDYRAFVRNGAEPPVAAQWRFLLDPLVPYEGGTDQDHDPARFPVQQLEDERIQCMTLLAFDNTRSLKRGDLIRLALYDDSGSSDSLPYSERYLEDFEADYCWDAFWMQDPAEDQGWADRLTTRYMCCGYGFTMIGEHGGGMGYIVKDTEGTGHFRKHYFKIGLIAHFHRASLLMFSDQLSDAVKEFDLNDDAKRQRYRRRVEEIQEDFLRFRSRYWFTEVSNHVQARALFELWTRHLGNRDLFEQVLNEIRAVNEVLNAKEQERQTTVATLLQVVAGIGLAMTILIGWLTVEPDAEGFRGRLGWTLGIVAAALVLLVAISTPLGRGFSGLARLGNEGWRRVMGCASSAWREYFPRRGDHPAEENTP